MALDLGSVRVGLASSDETGTIATPGETLARQPEARFWSLLQEQISARGARRVIIGLPRQMSGAEGKAAQEARLFASEVQSRLGCEVELWDERLTTVAAERSLIEQGVRRKRRRENIDSVAATLLLQSWLDARRLR